MHENSSDTCYFELASASLKFTCSDIVQNISLGGVKIPVQQE